LSFGQVIDGSATSFNDRAARLAVDGAVTDGGWFVTDSGPSLSPSQTIAKARLPVWETMKE
jgi:hypothetical protein